MVMSTGVMPLLPRKLLKLHSEATLDDLGEPSCCVDPPLSEVLGSVERKDNYLLLHIHNRGT